METRRLGNSGLYPSVVGFGAWAAGRNGWGNVEEKEIRLAIDKAVDLGITFFDTAPVYGFGESERVLGQALKAVRDKVLIATKCGLVWDDRYEIDIDLSGESIIREVNDSLRRLDTDYIDLYQVHWPDSKGTVPVEETFSALNELVQAGKIRSIGVSNFSVHQLVAAQSVAPIVSLQSPYNLLQRQVEYAELPYSEKQQLGFIPYSPLAQGLLTGKFNALTKFPDNDIRSYGNPLYKRDQFEGNVLKVELLQGIAKSIGKPLGQVAINWLLYNKAVTTVIAGAKTAAQVQENAAASRWKLSREDYEQISRLFEPDSSYVI
ncbi:Predicted oxidoreductase [Paenibacillus catalpae]|uniref:Predicted oxidoreductase n=1 Tax=Paenibacillus catalpae TaxID=1045775 RepID=A0A1I2GWX6_9BACL|nr:aldo/keto reductase [Paenibacillus catalpae]SFF22444.1 Predicted oxidoreductase [Paenibacillus catalpae]